MEPVREGRWQQIEWWLVHLIALHSVGVCLGLLFFTEWGARLGGIGVVSPLFFARQAGVFHLVAACVYVIDYRRGRGVNLLLMTKCFAVVFLLGETLFDTFPSVLPVLLLGETLFDTVPWVVPLSGLGDGLMALAVWVVHRKALVG